MKKRFKLSKEQKAQIKEYENKLIQDELNKRLLINAKTDFGLLETLIQQVNENPYLTVEINTADGTKVRLKTYNERSRNQDQINGNIITIQ